MKIRQQFNELEEQAYLKEQQATNPGYVRWLYVIFVALYGMFALIDVIYYPDDYGVLFLIRFGIVIPVLALTFLITFVRSLTKYHQYYIAFSVFIGGAGIAYMLILHPENVTYYGGLFLVFFSGYLLVKLRFNYATIAGVSILLFYLIGYSWTASFFSDTFMYGMIFFIGANLIGMTGAYRLEKTSREDFLHKRALAEKNSELTKQLDFQKEQFDKLNQSISENQELNRLNASLEESKEQYRLLTEKMQLGLALHEIICDDQGTPIDFRYLKVNESWERVIGVKKEDVLGKTAMSVFPNTESYWIEKFGEVALSGNSLQYENYSKELDKHLSISFYSPRPRQVATVVEDITERKRAEELILHASRHDYLTGLPNRRYFDEKIKAFDQTEFYPLLIAMVDIDGIKMINDTYGHQEGDRTIIRVANYLQKCCGDTSFIARVGGDEFFIISPKTSIESFKKKAEKLMRDISKIKVKDIQFSLSFGAALKADLSKDINDVIIEAENDMYANKVLHGQSSRSQIISALFDALTEKYDEEKIHSERVSHYCELMGEELNLSHSEKTELAYAGRMHDIGKITIPDEILKKADKLTAEEWTIMKTHTTNGYQILRSADQYSRLAEYALTHHERMDGKGYPQGLKGDQIPLFSRIIAIVDAYEAMTSDRPYRKAFDKNVAMEELKRCAGTQFDRQLVEIFINKVLSTEDESIS